MGLVTSPRLGLVAPDGNDRVRDGDDHMRNAFAKLDDLQLTGIPYRAAAGQATIVFAAATQSQLAITFPASRFTQSPRMTYGILSLPAAAVVSIRSSGVISPGGVTLVANASGALTGNVVVDWIGVQMVTASGSG